MTGAILWLAAVGGLRAQDPEVALSAEDQKRTDAFEAHSLAKADKLFAEKQYRAAAAEYDAFILEFPNSRVMAYALFRNARSLDLDNKRFLAIKKYKEVLDYYPNTVAYAAAAQFYMGEDQYLNGDVSGAVKTWTDMIQDADYSKHFLAASALHRLARYHLQQKNPEKAMACLQQAAVDFRTTNLASSWDSLWQVIQHRMVTEPNEPKLRDLYVKARGFDRQVKSIEGDAAAGADYWAFIRRQVKAYGAEFTEAQADKKKKFYQYWADALEGKFPDNDGFQLDLIGFRFAVEADADKRVKRLDAQFAKYQKSDNPDRIVTWMSQFPNNKAKIDEYYGKLDLAKLTSAGIQRLMFTLLELKENAMAQNAFDKIALKDMTDDAKEALAGALWKHVHAGFPAAVLVKVSEAFNDPERGRMGLLRFYSWTGNAGAGLPLGESLLTNPKYASDVLHILAGFLYAKGEYEKALARYQQWNVQPQSQYSVANCYLRLGKTESAVSALREIEGFFPNESAKAALMIANIYRDAKLPDKQVAALRGLLKKYPGSSESSVAHQELEKLGIKPGGGLDSD
ncbi:MAG: tetratricopeptide repeat protein [Lentisphaerae bacterium]|nr:tetratricopeptide repeat protein [Lentisphaerota bacterium]